MVTERVDSIVVYADHGWVHFTSDDKLQCLVNGWKLCRSTNCICCSINRSSLIHNNRSSLTFTFPRDNLQWLVCPAMHRPSRTWLYLQQCCWADLSLPETWCPENGQRMTPSYRVLTHTTTHTKQSPHTHTHVYKAVMHTSNVHKLKFFIWRKCTQPWSHCIRHATMQYCAISQLTYPNPITNTYKPQLLLSYHNDASTGSNCHDNHKPTHSNQALHNRMPGSGLSQCLQHGYNNITLSCNNNIRVHF